MNNLILYDDAVTNTSQGFLLVNCIYLNWLKVVSHHKCQISPHWGSVQGCVKVSFFDAANDVNVIDFYNIFGYKNLIDWRQLKSSFMGDYLWGHLRSWKPRVSDTQIHTRGIFHHSIERALDVLSSSQNMLLLL